MGQLALPILVGHCLLHRESDVKSHEQHPLPVQVHFSVAAVYLYVVVQ